MEGSSAVRRWPWWLAGVVVVVGGILFVRHSGTKPASVGAPRGGGASAVAVQAATVTRGTLTTSLTLVGVVAPVTQVNIAAQVSEPVVQLPVQLGDQVKKGQLLAQLDTSSLQAQLGSAEAALQQQQAHLAQIEEGTPPAQLALDKANLTKAQDAMEQAKVLQHDAQRTFDLNTAVTGSMQTQSQAQTTLDQANASYQAAVQAYNVAKAQLAADEAPALPSVVQQAQAAVAAAEAQVRAVQVQIGECTIKAPMDGTITSLPAAVGTLATTGAPLMTLQSGASVINVTVPEQQVSQVRVGETATVLPGSGAPSVPAHVTVMNPAGNTSTLTFPVQLVADTSSTALLPGQSVTVHLQTGNLTDAVLVPATAVQPISGQNEVYLIQGGAVHLVPITIAAQSPTEVAVASGLSAGQQVVVGSPPYLSDGARVIVIGATGAGAGSGGAAGGGATGASPAGSGGNRTGGASKAGGGGKGSGGAAGAGAKGSSSAT